MMTANFYKLPQPLATRRDVLPSAKIVYAVVVDSIGVNDHSWIGTRKLVRKTGLSRPTVMVAINQLAAMGLLLVEKRDNGKVSWYRLPETGQESLPGKTLDRSRNLTTGGQEPLPEAVKRLGHNQTDPLNQTHPAAAAASDATGKKQGNAHGDAFMAAFNAAFPEPYASTKVDFIQLATWRKAYPAVTPERFVEVAMGCWALKQYRPGGSMTIRGLCAAWAQLAAKACPPGGAAGEDAMGQRNLAILEARR